MYTLHMGEIIKEKIVEGYGDDQIDAMDEGVVFDDIMERTITQQTQEKIDNVRARSLTVDSHNVIIEGTTFSVGSNNLFSVRTDRVVINGDIEIRGRIISRTS